MADAAKPAVRLHVPSHMLERDGAGVFPFYRRLLLQIAEAGATTEVVLRDYDALNAGPQGASFDLVHDGGVNRIQVLNIAPGPLPGFFYLDPEGVLFESSITTKTFRPEIIEPQYSAPFAEDLRRKWIGSRQSRHLQPAETRDFGTGHIAVFLQDWSYPVERARYMTADQMVQTVVAGATGRRVVVKPHPKNTGRETRKIRQWLAKTHPEVRLTDANVHDILTGAAVCVSISSSVALEGMLHRVPAILFGRSDLHHCAETVQTAADWPAALDRALTRDWPYDAFLLWFLRRQNVDAGRPFLQKLLDRMTDQGADLAALGINPV